MNNIRKLNLPVAEHRDTDNDGPEMRLNRRQLNCMLLLGLAALAVPRVAASAQLSEPPYLMINFDWLDQARSRQVPARLYWPTAATAGRPVPLVVFSHGIGGSREGYSYLGKYWSARGVASLHVQHVGSDRALWRGNPFSMVDRLQAAAQEQEAIARAADVSFVLDRILSEDTGYYGAAINRQRLIAAGHSYGANTTLLTIGAQVVRDGQTINCLDSRFSAAVVISAPPFYGEPDLAAVLGKVAVPTMHVTATDDIIRIPGYRSGAEDRLAIFDAIASPHKWLAVFNGGSHSMFTDRSLTGGLSLNAKVKLATADLALAFFDLTFDGDDSALKQWQTQWQSILAKTQAIDVAPVTRMALSL
jgi:predicted dienelactone hydrolase